MAIAVSIQLELVGEDPVLEVASLINEAVIKAPKITDIVPRNTFISVLDYISKQFSLMAVSSGIPKEVLEPVTAMFGGEMASEWQFNATKQDYFLECGISDKEGNPKWFCTLQVIANCDEDEQSESTNELLPTNGVVH